MTLGKNLLVYIDGFAIAAAKSCQLSISQDFIQACSPDSGRVMEKIPNTYDWSISADCLVEDSTQPEDAINKLIEGTKVMLRFTDQSNQNRAGFAYIKSCNQSGAVGSLATFSISFESSGPLYRYREYKAATISGLTEGVEIQKSGNIVIYNYDDPEQIVKGVEILGKKGGLIYVRASKVGTNTWAVYSPRSLATTTNELNDGSQEALNTLSSKLQKVGENETGTVSTRQDFAYTVLVSGSATIYLLYP